MAVFHVVPPREGGRLAALRRYDILGTVAEPALDRITGLAARLFDVPFALVSIVDEDTIWFKSRHGLPLSDVERTPGLCASAILQDSPWVLTDAATDPRVETNPLVAGPVGLRFYAGVPLRTADGYNLGALWVGDTVPRPFTGTDETLLSELAGVVMDQLEMRFAARQVVQAEGELRRRAEGVAEALQASLLPPKPPTVPGMDVAARFAAGEAGLRVGGDFFDVFRVAENVWGIVIGDACGQGARPASLAALARLAIRAAAAQHHRPSAVLTELNRVMIDDGDADEHYCTAVYARLELDTCGAWLTTANAGHPAPLLIRRSGKVALVQGGGYPLGLFDRFHTPDNRVGLGPGDCLVLYTDGITEARNKRGMFGEEGLLRLAGRLTTATTAAELADAVMGAAKSYNPSMTDDAAVLILRVPDDAGRDPLARIEAAIGRPVAQLSLPAYPHGDGYPTTLPG